jgi:hypothetical protein
MTFANSLPVEEICDESHVADLWKDDVDAPVLFWAACDRCNRSLPGPGFSSEIAAASVALAQGWLLKPLFPTPRSEFITLRDLLYGGQLFCWTCSTEMDIDR